MYLGFLAFMTIALVIRCTNLYPLDGFGLDRAFLPPDQRGLLSRSYARSLFRVTSLVTPRCAGLFNRGHFQGAFVLTSNVRGLHFYPIWEAASLDE